MKYVFLIANAVLVAFFSAAMSPNEWGNKQILSISPNGSFSASEHLGSISLINNETGESVELVSNEDANYSLGKGNSVSNNGILVGSLGNIPGYLKDGKWYNLPTGFPQNLNIANGITPDGSRICGTVGTAALTADATSVPIQSPAVWDMRKDGTYSEPIMLPYPPFDYTGRVPQYVTAISISDDGKTIVGLVTDYSGFMTTLIYYTLNRDNKWVMHNEFKSLANPNGIEIPEYPGKCPEAPQTTDFMTEDERRAYQNALDAWYAAGTFDYATYPDVYDYMTEEEKTAYEAAAAAWQTDVYAPWQEAFDAFDEAVKECNGTSLICDNVLLSHDGETAISTAAIVRESPDIWLGATYENRVVSFNLRSNTYKKFIDPDMNASAIANNGTVLAFSKGDTPEQAWVYLPGETGDPISIMEYVSERDEESYKWMQESMVHDLVMTDPDTWETTTIEDYDFTGIPICCANMTVISCMTRNMWDYTTDTYSFLFPVNRPDSVEGVTNDSDIKILIFKGGRILIEGNAQSISVYDLNGRMVYSDGVTSGTICTGLDNGTYIIKATTPDGVRIRKAIF